MISRTIIIVLFFCISCNTNQKNTSVSTKSKIPQTKILGNNVGSLEFEEIKKVKLDTHAENILGNDLFVKLSNDDFYILDLDHQKSVLVFDSRGKYKAKIGKVGKGPGEYIEPRDFIINQDKIEIISGSGFKTSIYRYDHRGKFISSVPYEYIAFSFENIYDDLYAFSTSYNGYFSHRLYLSDENGIEVEKLLKNNTKISLPVIENCFSKFKTNLFYRESFNNTIYKIDNYELVPYLELDFGRYNIPSSFFSTPIEKGFEILNKNGFANIKRYYENKLYSLIEITIQKENSKARTILLLYNKKNKTTRKLTFEEGNNIFNYPIGLTEKDEIIFLVYPIGDIEKEFKSHGYEVDINGFNETNNPIITFNKIKDEN